MLVIVNADDMGISDSVNDAIVELLTARQISSATLMANAPATAQAAACVKHFPQCSFGVHLNLTQFEPLTGGPAAHWLVNENGQLSRHIETSTPRPERLRAIYQELCAQVERVAGLGVPISHLDSHHHVHTKPFVFPVLKALQRRYRIRKVRIAKNLYAEDQPCGPSLCRKKQVFNWALRSIYRTHTTAAFTELLSLNRIRPGNIAACRTIEVMAHPGGLLAAAERVALQAEWFGNRRMISYHELEA